MSTTIQLRHLHRLLLLCPCCHSLLPSAPIQCVSHSQGVLLQAWGKEEKGALLKFTHLLAPAVESAFSHNGSNILLLRGRLCWGQQVVTEDRD